jgi:hypothetical protein
LSGHRQVETWHVLFAHEAPYRPWGALQRHHRPHGLGTRPHPNRRVGRSVACAATGTWMEPRLKLRDSAGRARFTAARISTASALLQQSANHAPPRSLCTSGGG